MIHVSIEVRIVPGIVHISIVWEVGLRLIGSCKHESFPSDHYIEESRELCFHILYKRADRYAKIKRSRYNTDNSRAFVHYFEPLLSSPVASCAAFGTI